MLYFLLFIFVVDAQVLPSSDGFSYFVDDFFVDFHSTCYVYCGLKGWQMLSMFKYRDFF